MHEQKDRQVMGIPAEKVAQACDDLGLNMVSILDLVGKYGPTALDVIVAINDHMAGAEQERKPEPQPEPPPPPPEQPRRGRRPGG